MAYWDGNWDLKQVSKYYSGYYNPEVSVYDPLTEKRYQAILAQLERFRSSGYLLDVGCGTGHFLAVAAARGWQPVGAEISESALEFLRYAIRERRLKFSVVRGDIGQAGFSSESFDAVTLFEVIEHLEDPVTTLAEAYRLLKEGGILYVTTPNFDSLTRYLLGKRWRVIAEEHRCLFNPNSLKKCLTAIGFRPLKLVTKNVDIPEILATWRQSRQLSVPGGDFSATRSFRRTVEGSSLLRWAKRGTNEMLRWSHLGETIEALAVKQGKT